MYMSCRNQCYNVCFELHQVRRQTGQSWQFKGLYRVRLISSVWTQMYKQVECVCPNSAVWIGPLKMCNKIIDIWLFEMSNLSRLALIAV